MKGIQKVSVSNRDAKFDFQLFRNITMVRGDSGTGKTTLFSLIADYTRLGEASGVSISSTKRCVALIDTEWKNQLKGISDSIVFIDEGSDYITTEEFAKAIKRTNNYYVIFNREGLNCLPYSVEEIYEIHTSGRYHKFVKMFKSNDKHLYYSGKKPNFKKYSIILTEDSKSGYQFFEKYCEARNEQCISAESKSKLFDWLKNHIDENTMVIADGAAFGSEMDKVMKLSRIQEGNVIICLPESFEWLILQSDVISIKRDEIQSVLSEPSDHIDSSQYFSWENFFHKYLVDITKDTPFKYTKGKINKVYISDGNLEKIVAEIM